MKYSIIVPFYNEEKNVFLLNEEINKAINSIIKDSTREFEIIYVDDGSKDKTYEKMLECKKNQYKTKLIRHKYNLSQSSALFTGIKFSNYDNLIFLDGDGQNDPNDLIKMVQLFEQGKDMVTGWRKNRKDNFIVKTLPSIFANSIVRIFTNSKIHDQGCGIKILKKEMIDFNVVWGDFHRLLSARLSNNLYEIEEVEVNHR